MSDASKQILTTSEAGERLGLARGAVARLCEDGLLVGAYLTRPGGHWRIPQSSIDKHKAATRPHKRFRLTG